MAEAGPLLGAVVELDVGQVAHGGSCVARHEGRVVFVRHALPGERVTARVTEDRGGAYCRADVVDVLVRSPERVKAPCPHAGPGRCGGCDWQHASPSAQRELKASVVRDQFTRLAGMELDAGFRVEELPGGSLGWRTRITFGVGPDGRPGMHRHRSAALERVEVCPLGVPGVGDSPVWSQRWPGCSGIEVVHAQDEVGILEHRPGPGRQARGRRPPDRVTVVQGPARLAQRINDHEFLVAASGFWQVHPHAAPAFAAALIDGLSPRPGEAVLDLYAGAGALSVILADAVGNTGRVVAVESSRQAAADAAQNLAAMPWAQVLTGRVTGPFLAGIDVVADLVVLDPPRAGAGREVMNAVIGLAPRAIGYVGCDPASLARDVRTALDAGWRLDGIRAFDAFPMTHHVECVAILTPAGQSAAGQTQPVGSLV
ncbi:MAG: TRAM domain-containing protein [Actinomycetota bacterium]|nr:TRAM domain-containing protein [Actinomycetota bacterium]